MLGRLAAAALRGGGRLVVAQVVPDAITPWHIRRNVSNTSSSILKSARKGLSKKGKKQSKGSGKNSLKKTRNVGRSSQNDSRNTRPKHDKQSWSQGRGLRSSDAWTDDTSTSSPRTSFWQRARNQARRTVTDSRSALKSKRQEFGLSARNFGRSAVRDWNEEVRLARQSLRRW